jgi:hypothetical protein
VSIRFATADFLPSSVHPASPRFRRAQPSTAPAPHLGSSLASTRYACQQRGRRHALQRLHPFPQDEPRRCVPSASRERPRQLLDLSAAAWTSMIQEIQISSWKEILDLEIEFSDSVFRGQSDASWPLETSLLRRLQGTEYQEDPTNTEFWCFREFRRRAQNYLAHLPEEDDYIAWLSLMQHYGSPTRLLDFSHSFYVAAYFALRGSKSNAAVWSIDMRWLQEIAESAFSIKLTGLRDEWDDTIYSCANNLLHSELKTASGSGENCPLGVVYAEPFRLHQRLSAQQGVFLLPLNIENSFLANLTPHHLPGNRSGIRKITLSTKVKDQGLAHLRSMNISEETLFPGLDGMARSLMNLIILD